jgi:hypothetical protein
MMKLLFVLALCCPVLAFAKVKEQKVHPLISLKVDDGHWSVIETEKLFSSKIPILFNKKHEDIFGPVFSAPLLGYSTGQSLEKIKDKECVSAEFKTQYVSVQKDKRFVCDISYTKEGKEYRQLWIIDRIGSASKSFFQKTIISFSIEARGSDDLNEAVDGLKRSIAGSK